MKKLYLATLSLGQSSWQFVVKADSDIEAETEASRVAERDYPNGDIRLDVTEMTKAQIISQLTKN